MFGGTVLSQIWNAYEARKNRDFQERMSSTAHQREVADLRAAGINPMLSRMGSGASTPGGDRAQIEDLGKGASSALQVRLLAAQEKLLIAQGKQATQAAVLSEAQAGDIAKQGQAGRYERISSEADSAAVSLKEAQTRLKYLAPRLRAEIEQLGASADVQRANAVLAKLERAGAVNAAEWEKLIGTLSPASKLLLNPLMRIFVR